MKWADTTDRLSLPFRRLLQAGVEAACGVLTGHRYRAVRYSMGRRGWAKGAYRVCRLCGHVAAAS